MTATDRSRRRLGLGAAAAVLAGVLALTATAADARRLAVDVRTDRGDQAVYQPGQPIGIDVRPTDDAYLLVYEIDAEGAVHVLYPYRNSSGYVEAGTTLSLPPDNAEQLVVEGPVGEGYIVAIASSEPFRDLPWYLRPYDAQAEEMGYAGDGEDRDDSGVTADGRIVGDPFVAMERIRRAVLDDPTDRESFATAYTSYYVHDAVRYPRYICNDCHRPGAWQWWDGFDPYYSTCSVFDFRVNSGWWWGPSYWFGTVPYYVFVYRPDCPPRFRRHGEDHAWFSSWDGWRRWNGLWGGDLRRYKTPPPTNYVSPARFNQVRGANRSAPPGFLASVHGEERQFGGIRRARISGDPGSSPARIDRPFGRGIRPEPGFGGGRLGQGGGLWRRSGDGAAGIHEREGRGAREGLPPGEGDRGQRPARGNFGPQPDPSARPERRGDGVERPNFGGRPVYDTPRQRAPDRGGDSGGQRSSPPPDRTWSDGGDRGGGGRGASGGNPGGFGGHNRGR